MQANQKRATIDIERLGTFPLTYSIDPDEQIRFEDNVKLGAEALDIWTETPGLRRAADRLFGKRLEERQLLQVVARLMAAAMAGHADDKLSDAILEEHRKAHYPEADWKFSVALSVNGGRRVVQVNVRFGEAEECEADARSQPA